MSEGKRSPTRVMRALPEVYHFRRRLGDTMTESGFSATPVSDSECTTYIRADEHERVKAQRDRCLEALKAAPMPARTAGRPGQSISMPEHLRLALAAIAACEG